MHLTLERPMGHFDFFFHMYICSLNGVFGKENMAKFLDDLSSVNWSIMYLSVCAL